MKFLIEYPEGLYLLKNYLRDIEINRLLELVKEVNEQDTFMRYTMFNGKTFNALMTNCGQYGWYSDHKGYRYVEENPVTGKPWTPMPEWMRQLALSVLTHSCYLPEHYDPQSCLINLYEEQVGKLGKHVDNTEFCDSPIISLSIGASGILNIPQGNILLEEGDVLVMSGPARFFKHGITKIVPQEGKAPHRIVFTIRQVYPLVGKAQSFRHIH